MITQALKMAVKAMTGNKMRSFLTMLGVIIGVLSITVLVSLVSSTTDEVTGRIEDLGSNMLVVSVTSDRYDPVKLKELDAIAQAKGVLAVAPSLTGRVTARANSNEFSASVEGTTALASLIRKWEVTQGRFLLTPDITNSSPVAVIGVNVANELFGTTENVVGHEIRVNGAKCIVIGLLEEQGRSVMGSDDDKIIIPYTFCERLLSQKGIKSFYVAAESPTDVPEAEANVEAYLLRRFRQDEDAYNIISQDSILDMMNTITGLMTTLLGGIAAISLLVGGIGIMNIMLVSVSERTREIGIRKAVGASRRDILTQFLIEALMISLIGGIIGIGLSYVALLILQEIMDMVIIMSPGVVAISLGFSIGVGLLFGMHPANKASRLHPIDALRHEF